MDLNLTGILIKRRETWTKTRKQDDHVKVEAEIRVVVTAKECLGLQEAGKGKEGSSPRGFGGSTALETS